MVRIFTRNVSYVEASFTLARRMDEIGAKKKLEDALRDIFDKCAEDVLITVRYGKDFRTLHVELEFINAQSYLNVEKALKEYVNNY